MADKTIKDLNFMTLIFSAVVLGLVGAIITFGVTYAARYGWLLATVQLVGQP